MELDLAEAEKVLAHELRLDELKSTAGTNGVQNNSNSGNTTLCRDLKLPTFNDNQDDMDSFLPRFERIAEVQQWKRSEYHIYLGLTLRGHALKVYVSLPMNIVTNYEKVKDALLRAFSVDADLFRCKFRESKCGNKESFIQIIVRMEQYLERWLSMSEVDKVYDSLFDFLIREQMLSNCNPELSVFLKERRFDSSLDMAEAADQWKSAHNNFRTKNSKPPTDYKT